MTKSDLARFVEDAGRLAIFQQERLLLDVTELMQKALDETGTRRSELAKKLGLTRGRITQLLGGEENLTLRTVADVFTAMGKHLGTTLEDINVEPEHWYSIDVDGEGQPAMPLTRIRSWVMACDTTDPLELFAG